MIYFPIGFEHIVSLAGFDHLLFIIVLCAPYAWQDWRRVLVLLTGFTLGHSFTLALVALRLLVLPQSWVEMLIPVTILITSLVNVAQEKPGGMGRAFALSSCFGLIHGCGFAGYFAMMLGDGESILGPLFGFNLGLEAGQVLTVLVFYTLFFGLERIWVVSQRSWTVFVSGAGAGLGLKMLLDLVGLNT